MSTEVTKSYKCELKLPGFDQGKIYHVQLIDGIAATSAWRKRLHDAKSDGSFSEVKKSAKTSES